MTATFRALMALVGLGASIAIAAPSGAAQEPTQVVIDTSMGPITVELDAAKAPITVANFLKYVDSGHYDNTVFHRVIGPNPRQPQGFMIQGGGFANESPIREKPTGEGIKNESTNGLSNRRGTIAMARTNDPNSATAQWYVNLSDNTPLDTAGGGYAVFGKVVGGMEVVDKIARMPTGTGRALASGARKGQLSETEFDDVPTTPVVIKSVKRKAP